jgi:hypothetical protein
MIHTCLKSQGETPVNYQYTPLHALKNEGQEGKIGLLGRVLTVRGGGHKERVNMVDVFCIHV